jgi:hypothetical protein
MKPLVAHLKDRYFDLHRYSGVTVDEQEVTLPLWNLSGQMVGYQVYNPSKPKKQVGGDPRSTKYFTYVTPGQNGVWGLETVNWKVPFFFLTEGVFDACRFHHYEMPAVAVLGNNPHHLHSWLRSMSNVSVAAVQGDTAGMHLALHASEAVYLPKDKDVGELTDYEFNALFRRYMSWDK